MRSLFAFLYQWFIFLPIFFVATIVTALVVMVGCTFGNHKFWGYVPPKYWSRLTCLLALCPIRVERRGVLDPNQSYIFVPNHQSAFDIFLTYGYLGQNIKWVQKQSLRKIPFVGKASEIAGHIFVDQSSLRSMKDTIQKAKEELEEGISIVMFPEGARTMTGKMGKFKRGAFVIANEMELPIVPITINGAFDVLKIHTWLIKPHKMELIIHEPISTKNIDEDGIHDLVDKSFREIEGALWEKYK